MELAYGVEGYDAAAIEAELDAAIKEEAEGLMIKALHGDGGKYVPGQRSLHWIKLKKDYIDGLRRHS